MAIERGISGVVINRLMIGKGMTYDECMEKSMSPVQKDGCSPTLRQIADVRGKTGIGNTKNSQNILTPPVSLQEISGGGMNI